MVELEDVKILLGITDDTKDDLIQFALDNADKESILKQYNKVEPIPEGGVPMMGDVLRQLWVDKMTFTEMESYTRDNGSTGQGYRPWNLQLSGRKFTGKK